MLVPIVIGAVVLSVVRNPRKDPFYGKMTQERSNLYQSALASKTLTADDLMRLGDLFEKNGLKAEAILLRNRGRLRGLSPDQRLARKQIFRKAMASKDADAVENIANVFESQGATGSAQTLRMMVVGLRNATRIEPVDSPKQEPQSATPAPAVEEPKEKPAGEIAEHATEEAPHAGNAEG